MMQAVPAAPSGDERAELLLLQALQRLPKDHQERLHTLAGDADSLRTMITIHVTPDLRTRLLPLLRGSGVLSKDTAELYLTFCERCELGPMQAFLRTQSPAEQAQFTDPEVTAVIVTESEGGASGKKLMRGVATLSMMPGEEARAAAKEVLGAVQRLSSTYKEQLEKLATLPGGVRSVLKLILTPAVYSKLVPAVKADTRPVLRPSTSDLLMKHISCARMDEVARLQQLWPTFPWHQMLQPSRTAIVSMTEAGKVVDLMMQGSVGAEAGESEEAFIDEMIDKIYHTPSLVAARNAVGEEALLAQLGLAGSMAADDATPQQTENYKTYARELLQRLRCRCNKCGKVQDEPFQACGKCKLLSYCGRECQAADWSCHKRDCKAAFGFRIIMEQARAGNHLQPDDVMAAMGTSRSDIEKRFAPERALAQHKELKAQLPDYS